MSGNTTTGIQGAGILRKEIRKRTLRTESFLKRDSTTRDICNFPPPSSIASGGKRFLSRNFLTVRRERLRSTVPTCSCSLTTTKRLCSDKGICSESVWCPIKRDIELSRKTGCHYHVCHISTKESVDIIRKAKAEGVNITCETGPHYLTLNDMDLQEDGRFKMNPPIRSEEDRLALIEGIKDGTIDMIITDHAPHSAEEKSKGLAGSSMGVVGLEVAFPVLYTNLVKPGIITLEKLIDLMNTNPRKIFKIGTEIKEGQTADLTVYDLKEQYDIDSSTFVSMGKATPFDGNHVYGKCKMTICSGKVVYGDCIWGRSCRT